jgi:hypothetical protein
VNLNLLRCHPVSTVLELQKLVKKQKYDCYFSLGFTCAGDETALDALSVMCNKVLLNSSTLSAKLRRHRDTNHPEYKDKDISDFKRKFQALTNCQSIMVKSSKTDNENARALLQDYRIALAGEAHTVAETLIKPCAVGMATCVLGEQSKKEIL